MISGAISFTNLFPFQVNLQHDIQLFQERSLNIATAEELERIKPHICFHGFNDLRQNGEFQLLNGTKNLFQSVRNLNNIDIYMKCSNFSSFYGLPDFNKRLFDDAVCLPFIKKTFPQHYQMAVDFPYGVQRSDFCRILYIYEYGGVYADSDVVFTKHPSNWVMPYTTLGSNMDIEMIVGRETTFTKGPSNPCQIVQWTFASRPKHDVLKFAIEDIAGWYSRAPEDFANREMIVTVTGPGVFSRSVVRYLKKMGVGLEGCAKAPSKIGSLYIGPVNMFNCGTRFDDVDYPCNEHRAIRHLFGSRWKGLYIE